jgi:hypothetical protein
MTIICGDLLSNIENDSKLVNLWSQAASGDRIPLETEKVMIVEALSQFDPELGFRAKSILDNEQRTNIVENLEIPKGRMACRPAGITKADLIKMGMFIPQDKFEEKYGPDFTVQINESDAAIIDLEYEGSTKSVVYLVHELGHAIADDIQRESKKNFREFSSDELEEQAYLVQGIFSHYTKQSSPESLVASGQQDGEALGISWERAQQYKSADSTLKKALETGFHQRGAFLITALGGGASLIDKPSPSIDKNIIPGQ